MPHAIQYRRLRAPREHGQVLIDPPLGEAVAQIEKAREQLERNRSEASIGLDAKYDARQEMIEAAQKYTCNYLSSATGSTRVDDPIIMAGHQPGLFHPGVWFKNFVLSSLAAKTRSTAINLVIDNDVVTQPAIRVPRGEIIETVAYDRAAPEIPYEQRPVLDAAMFDSFAARVAHPLADRLWSNVRMLRMQSDCIVRQRLGGCIAAARHLLEAETGLRTLELPLSVVCQTDGFARFACWVLRDLPRFHAIHNESLQEYRTANHIRSHTHPVPELNAEGDWLEAPFWIWSEARPTRRPVFARADKEGLVVRGGEFQFVLPHNASPTSLRETARNHGVKIRPRALMTTMYVRHFLCDLFVHGIGGAKYDQLTDAIIERFFGIPAPKFMTATATMQLHPTPGDTAERLRAAEQAVREFPFHPEVYVESSAPLELQRLREKKEQWLKVTDTGSRKAWREALVELNQQLADAQPQVLDRLRAGRDALEKQLAYEKLFGSREFSFVLFDEELPQELKRLAEHPT
jgi:hypothetical protein